MRWIDTNDLQYWSGKPESKTSLPFLISRLVRATTTKIIDLKIPKGKMIYRGGWDGVVISGEVTEFVPKGISLWEFGTEDNPEQKAEKDYLKRTANPGGYDAKDCTFVFITTRVWEKKDEWIDKKKKEGNWNNIKVYDAQKLEEWLSIAPIQSYWLAQQIGKMPDDGIEATNDFWENWATGPTYKLNPKVLTAGRENEVELLKNKLIGKPCIITIKASSRDEAIAFFVASILQYDDEIQEAVLSRNLIVEDARKFKVLVSNTDSLILIPKFESTSLLHNAVSKGHFIIFPAGPDDNINELEVISLPHLDREKLIKAFEEMGLSYEKGASLSKESGRNITILRRNEGFEHARPEWAQANNAREIIPALLIGRWDEAQEKDREIVAKAAGEGYKSYIAKLSKWKGRHDSPVYNFGNVWRLSSPLDAWSHLSKYLTTDDFQNINTLFLDVLRKVNPSLELEPEKRYMAAVYNKLPMYSHWVREGLTQSLIIIAVYGDRFKLNVSPSSQLWVDQIVATLLKDAPSKLWQSLNSIIPLLAEASPASFMSAMEDALENKEGEILQIFEEADSPLTPINYHTGFLWALEGIAWMPEQLSRAALLLASLATRDPGGKITNRPQNSLRTIFLAWMPQTLASMDQRLDSIKLIAKKHPAIGWKLCVALLPQHHDSTSPTHSLRWRFFGEKPTITDAQIFNFYSQIIDILIELGKETTIDLHQLVAHLPELMPQDREKVLEFLFATKEIIRTKNQSVWDTLRHILHRHRSHPEVDWSLPEAELLKLEKLYNGLTPSSKADASLWMFKEQWPEFPEGEIGRELSYEDQEKEILKRRIDCLKEYYKANGLTRILETIPSFNGWIIGYVLAYFIDEEQEVLRVCELLKSAEVQSESAVSGFMLQKAILNGVEWLFRLYDKLKEKNYKRAEIAKIFVNAPQGEFLWNFLSNLDAEIEEIYWKKMRPWFYRASVEERIYGIEKLAQYNRHYTNLDVASHCLKDIQSLLLIQLLENAAKEKADDQIRLDGYDVYQIFEELETRDDFDKNALANLEWIYIPILSSYGSRHKPKRLHDELDKNPSFFIEIIKCLYKPKNEEQNKDDKSGPTDEQRATRAHKAYDLLKSWESVPGLTDAGINKDELLKWVSEVRRLAETVDRINIVDVEIGKMLSHYPNRGMVCPSEEICEVIDTVATDEIKRGYRTGIFNRRGTYSKGAFEGGKQERSLSLYFKKLADERASKWPITASILEALSKDYEAQAIAEDNEALREDLEN